MSYKRITKFWLIISIILFILGIFLINTDFHNLAFVFGQPLTHGLAPVIIILTIIYFLNENIFRLWSKVAAIIIPLLVLFVVVTPVECSGGGFLEYCLDKR